MLREFREFAVRGNMVDLAVGLIIGAAFGAVVTSLVNDVLMPPLGLLLGRIDFGALFLDLSDQAYPSLRAAREAGAPVIAYGAFLNTVVNFFIVAFAVFQVVRVVNRFRRQEAPAAATTTTCPYCGMIIPLVATRCPYCTSGLA
ncbi:MAG: large conductance mechanosensitive channel protein MscL [Armatimonadota bacterium]|nr:large conductance mechanosensitive channel protein MscL [Armatimonadota bacterium]MDR7423144.1 large conductance mechanosensitive channel protein MscL [Armatimonadota bacterium]MDR7455035.1 large conductance mechanosensitive channel protein MscL [Armatimonadota bacterium]MDR7457629.1 large conductance mechanosensitive channel protein MscL [Armatimonadota bacterium]MDR7496528.1 large conductance mechanosensitive channel protein MscL [Armatimonadota bacterium]